jgi:hypothetical protein
MKRLKFGCKFPSKWLSFQSQSTREGSRVKITLKDEQWRCHRPHPGKEAKRYQVEEVRELLERIGVHP